MTDQDAVGYAEAMAELEGILDELEAIWRGRVDRMEKLLAEVPEPERSAPSTERGR